MPKIFTYSDTSNETTNSQVCIIVLIAINLTINRIALVLSIDYPFTIDLIAIMS